MDSVDCSDACPAAVVSGAPSLGTSSSVASQLYVDQFSCSLPTQHCLSVPQCAPVDPPHFQLHLPRPPPPQVQPLLAGQSYPQHSAGSTPGLGMLYNPAVSPLVKREARTRDVSSGVVGGWHTMSGVGYRDRRLVQSVTTARNSTTPVAVSSQLQHQHELNTRTITNNNHDGTNDRKKSRRSGKVILFLLIYFKSLIFYIRLFLCVFFLIACGQT